MVTLDTVSGQKTVEEKTLSIYGPISIRSLFTREYEFQRHPKGWFQKSRDGVVLEQHSLPVANGQAEGHETGP